MSKNAEAYISQIWKKDKFGSFVKVEKFRAPVKLKWSHEAAIFPIDILPRNSRRLDVCFMCQGENILHLMSEGFPSGTIKNELEFGKYVFEIVVVSQNSLRPARFLFSINCDEEWKNLKGASYIRSFIITKKPARSFIIYN